MKKSLCKISIVCAACSMLGTSAWAQSVTSDNKSITDQNSPPAVSPEQNTRSWSTKHLSATGRNTDGAIRASRLVGAQVSDSNGKRAGQIQDIIVNPVSGRIDFALLSLNASQNSGAMPSSSEKVVPVPWALLRASSSAQYSSSEDQPQFTLNCDQSKVNSAPTVDWSNLTHSEWRQRIYSYYGVTPQSSVGGAESPQGEMKGEGKMQSRDSQPVQQPQQTPQPQSNQ
ncbi:MAG TPA: PRC-barrel domain-containing protein [Verrucomicrobiae bacterium]|nr:PRC-barrel domain-containing protein [Verrucomicrobiae bacterium]